jgi:hypothetical protein
MPCDNSTTAASLKQLLMKSQQLLSNRSAITPTLLNAMDVAAATAVATDDRNPDLIPNSSNSSNCYGT